MVRVSETKRSRAALSADFLVEHVPDPVNHRIRNQVSGAPARMPPAAGFGVNVYALVTFFGAGLQGDAVARSLRKRL
jgi:hypothetical protein